MEIWFLGNGHVNEKVLAFRSNDLLKQMEYSSEIGTEFHRLPDYKHRVTAFSYSVSKWTGKGLTVKIIGNHQIETRFLDENTVTQKKVLLALEESGFKLTDIFIV